MSNNIDSNAKECEALYKELEQISEILENSNDGELSVIVNCVSRGIEVSNLLKERFDNLKISLNEKFDNN